uniref:SRE1b n=1 Tax=Solanum tuberosum TaxID=4113 RepID=O49969_SOLTU|nr:SRE1b [Solanum tuberosum]
MPGALAWQVTKPNKDAIFVFGGEMVRGFLPDSPLCVSSLASLLCFLELSARSTQINVSSNLAFKSPYPNEAFVIYKVIAALYLFKG